jgi:hypothetical protein
MSASGNVALALDNSTVAANSSAADAVGGILLDAGATNPPSAGNALPPTVTLRSSIVADSLNGAPDIGTSDEVTLPTATVNASQSLIGTVEPSVSVVGSGNLLGVNPNLGPLAFNGGNSQTQALLAGSPAINAGSNPANLATDQRGASFPRVVGVAADMGAFESGSGSPYARDYVQKAYVAYYGRPADPGGLGYWAGRMDAEGQSLDAIIGAFGYSDEFNRRYGGLSFAELVPRIYQQALGRAPDLAGLNWYIEELMAGRRTLQTITLDVLNGATTAPDSTVVANKLDVAAYYSAKVAAGCLYGTEQDGLNALAGVTAESITVVAAKAAIDSRCGP